MKSKPTIISVTGGKGGVGKTQVALNLSISLGEQHKKVLLLDADLGLSNIDILLGLKPKLNLSHVMNHTCQISDIILKGPMGIDVLPASSGVIGMVSQDLRFYGGLMAAIDSILDGYDYFIIDTAAGISSSVIPFLCHSDELIVVFIDDPTSIMDAYAVIKVMNQQYARKKFHVIPNCVKSMQEGSDLFAKLTNVASRFLHVSLNELGWVPEDGHVRKAAQKQKSVVDMYPGSKIAEAFRLIAKKLISQKQEHRQISREHELRVGRTVHGNQHTKESPNAID